MPNLAVIEELKAKEKRAEILYIGEVKSIEKKLAQNAGIKFKGIPCGKLRRYFSLRNFVDPFKVVVGSFKAYKILKKFGAELVFSKGGFVSVPVVLAARFLKVPVILHESDAVPGLANKLLFRFADKVCLSFEESKKYLKKYLEKVVVTGNPIRKWISSGERAAGYKFTGLDKFRPIILVMGGSQGSLQINNLIEESLGELLKKFQIVHIRGRGNLDISLHKKGYVQYEYLDEKLNDVYAISEMVISRGGANSLFEIASLKKKALIIPLAKGASRGEQLENARIMAGKLGWAILEGEISGEDFVRAIEMAYKNKFNEGVELENGVDKIVEMILKYK